MSIKSKILIFIGFISSFTVYLAYIGLFICFIGTVYAWSEAKNDKELALWSLPLLINILWVIALVTDLFG